MSVKERKLNHNLLDHHFGSVSPKPAEIFIVGESFEDLLPYPRVGIIGSRSPTPYGKAVTEKIARELAEAGVVIISGLALGVDGLAQQAVVNAGRPTIAVLPAGLDTFYPRSHQRLAEQILDKGGALISEYPRGVPPRKQHFIARNRLVAALSDILVITEAAERSGTIHTVSFALEQGKTVMAMPGPITSNLSMGTNMLIKTGAAPVLNSNDILHELGINPNAQQQLFGANREEQVLLDLMAAGIQDGYELLHRSKLATATYNQTMTMLEISGRIKSLGANQWIIC